ACTEGGPRPSEDVVVNGFYALQKMSYSPGAEVGLAWLGGACEASEIEQCAAADALRYIATEDELKALERRFTEIPSDMECGYAMWRYHEEKALEIVEAEPLRAKIVRAVGNRKDYDSYEWIWAVGANENEHPKTRKVAEIYAREMLAAYERENKRK